ncbi:MAG: hypothetical protein ACM31C_26625, partial [Acidobacteriota bacterium]
EVNDDDVKNAGRALVALAAVYLALLAIPIGLTFGDTMRGSYSRRRAIAAVALLVVASAVAIAVHVGWREAVFEANDELATQSFAMGSGAWVMPIGAVAALAGAIALLVLQLRSAAQPDAERA